MACCLQVLSRFVPSRVAHPRATTFPASRTDESSHFNARGDTVLQSTPDFVPDGLPSRILRIGCSSPPGFGHSNEYFLHHCQPLHGFQDCHITTYVQHSFRAVLQLIRLEFDTQANATRAAGSLSLASLDRSRVFLSYLPDDSNLHPDEDPPGFEILRDLSSLTVMEEDATSQPARKKAKLTITIVCRICTNGITGPYSKPCLRCKKPWCLDCVKTWFTMATNDFERMPARCCNIVMHHGVAGGTLSAVEYDMYKLRYDEQTTANPLYCPVPTCSTFIPSRLIDSNQSTVNCTVCTTRICTNCKQLAAVNHVCQEEAAAIQIKAFNYKTCPKCGTAVMKMYGCPHVRCVCGAHVCWDCMRALAVCYRSPCASAIEDGQYGDEDDGISSDSEEDFEDAGTIMDIASGTQQVDSASTRNAQVEIAGRGNAAQALLNVFRGRRHRGADLEERRRVIGSIAQVEREMTAESAAAAIPASEDSLPLGLSAPATSTIVAPATLTIVAPAFATPLTEATPLDCANPTVPNDSEEPDNSSCVHEECDRSPGSLYLEERSNMTPPDALTEQLPEQQTPPSDTAVLAPADLADTPAVSTDSTDTRVPTRLSSLVAAPPALELPVASSSNIDLYESSFATRPNPAIIPPTLITAPPTLVSVPLTPNLDDPDLLNWEAEPYDFGDEPVDESFDVWGCACTFTKLKKDAVDSHWMDLRYLDCMRCFGEVVLYPAGAGGSIKRSEKERLAWHCFKCGVVVCGRCAREKKGVVRGLMRANGREEG